MPGYTGVILIIYDFQTLITGAAAVGAALIATRYGRRQMRLMTRELLVNRGKDLAGRRAKTATLLQDIRGMLRHIRPWEDETVAPDAMWTHNSEHAVDMIVLALREHQDTSLDGQAVDLSRKALIDSSEVLSRCLYDIHAAQSVDFGGFEEPPLSAKPEYEARAAKASGELEERLSQVLKLAGTLDEAFDARLTEIRRELLGLERFALRR